MTEKEFYLIIIEKSVELINLAMAQPNQYEDFIAFQLNQIQKQVDNLRQLS